MMDESEWETESEQLVIMEVRHPFPSSLLDSSTFAANVKFVGMESATPYVQIADKVFAGKFVDTMGSSLLFDHRSDVSKEEDVFDRSSASRADLRCVVDKKLVVNRVFVTPRDKKTDDNDKERPQEKRTASKM